MRIWKQSEHHNFHEDLIFGKTRPLDKPQRVVGNGKPNPEVGDIMIMAHCGDVLSFVVTEFVEEFTKDSGFIDVGLDGYWAVNVVLTDSPPVMTKRNIYDSPKIEFPPVEIVPNPIGAFMEVAFNAIIQALFKKK